MGGGGTPHEIPDWRTYKAEGIPQLDRLQRRLGALGLRDPWIRNEAWKFAEVNGGTTPMSRVALRVTFRGLGIALAAVAATIVYDKVTNKGADHGHH